jgi:hypothetical protein
VAEPTDELVNALTFVYAALERKRSSTVSNYDSWKTGGARGGLTDAQLEGEARERYELDALERQQAEDRADALAREVEEQDGQEPPEDGD